MSRWLFYPLCVLSLIAGMIVGSVTRYAIEDALRLPPCATEDSDHCYWDASHQGNGLGSDFVSP